MRLSAPFIAFCAILAATVCAEENVEIFAVGKYNIHVGGATIKTFEREDNGEETLVSERRLKNVDLRNPFKSTKTAKGVTLEWGEAVKMTFTAVRNDNCVTHYGNFDPKEEVEDCYPYGDAQWYGGPERSFQEWPVQTAVVKTEPYVTREANNQAVVEPYWLNSKGKYIYMDNTTPLFFDSNDRANNSLCLVAALRGPYKPRPSFDTIVTYCSLEDVTAAHYDALNYLLGRPDKHPSPYLMSHPIYSTWVRYGRDVNDQVIRSYTDELYDHGFLPGQIDIDDRWETCYGSLTFDTTRFPNITDLTNYMRSKGATASLWIHPFVGIGCDLYQKFKDEGRLVANEKGNVAMVWWNGGGAVIDLTNTTTKDWWVGRLKDLKKSSGLDGYKLDAGESSWMPQLPNITGNPALYPDFFVQNFVEAAMELDPSNLEIRVGRGTQTNPVYMRFIDKSSRWGLDNGLHTIITGSFQMGLAGYPFILPDMIGGNTRGDINKELFIRWLQANALLPALQFSVVPWDFDDETVEISSKFFKLRNDYMDYLTAAAEDTIADGRPIISPLWFFSPKDNETFAINDEYQVGENLLVAPIIKEGAIARDIYLPAGNWLDTNTNSSIQGPVWLRNYSAPLDVLPLFKKTT